MSRPLLLGVLACVTLSAWGGQIIFVDPVREKAQALELQKDVIEVEKISPASERAREARAYLNDTPTDKREKAQALELQKDVIEVEKISPASERAREARAYLNDTPTAQPNVILINSPPPTDATRARQKAREWVAPVTVNPAHASSNRCKTENTVGGIEGSVRGYSVIQSNTSNVTNICR